MDEPLADETLVVRGGLMELDRLRDSLEDAFDQGGFYNLSFWGEDGFTLEQLIEATNRNPEHPPGLPHPRLRVAPVAALRLRGHEPYRTDPWPHLAVRFDRLPTDEELRDLVSAFAAVPNPSPAT